MTPAQFYTSDSYPITENNSIHIEGHVCAACYKKQEMTASLINILGRFLIALGMSAGAFGLYFVLGEGLSGNLTAALRGLMFALFIGGAVMLIKGLIASIKRISDIGKVSADLKFYSAYASAGGKIKDYRCFYIDPEDE